MPELLRIHNLHKRFPPGERVFHGAQARLAEGEFVWLTGPSGAGKSTLLNMIAGVEAPSQGQILVQGQDITQLSRRQMPAYRQHLGLIFQDPMLLPDRDVYQNIALSLDIRGRMPATEQKRRVDRALSHVGLSGRGRSMPAHLSGGEAARVAIARALVAGPRLVLADEPTGNLDAALARDILQLFVAINQLGVSLIVASHDETLIADYPATRWRIADHQLQVGPSA